MLAELMSGMRGVLVEHRGREVKALGDGSDASRGGEVGEGDGAMGVDRG